MKLFHLSYDNGKMDAKEVARVLRDKLNGGLRGSDPNGGVRVVGLCEIMV